MIKEETLSQTNDRPYSFNGEEILVVSDRDRGDKKSSRWWTIKIFRAVNWPVPYIVGVSHLTTWRTERDLYYVIEAKNKKVIPSKVKSILDSVTEYPTEINLIQEISEGLGIDNEPVGSGMEPKPL